MAALLKKHIAILSFIFGISISTILTSFWTFSSSWSLVKQQKDDFLIDIDNPTNDENTNKERIDYNNIKDTKVPSGDIDILDELNILSGGDKSHELDCPWPLTPFHNRIVRDNDNANNQTQTVSHRQIPRIIHLSMKSRCVGRDYFDICRVLILYKYG